ncbi:hypothetical protein [Sphingomonas sp. HMP6]|uniref:hypothetical protein n=1 Tax=Sphingomonas sp. HMP6 TaxID=1517551 RepID=UPI001596BAF9|nr:hypothetical protein [Sphingomonas sp. HMP6]
MASPPNPSGRPPAAKAVSRDVRQVVDHLPRSFDVGADESTWLLTLLSANELRYIFEGKHDDDQRSN